MKKDNYYGMNYNGNIEIISQDVITESIENMNNQLEYLMNYVLSNNLIMFSKLHFLYKQDAYDRLTKLIEENNFYSRRKLDEIGKYIRDNIYKNMLIIFLENYELEKEMKVFKHNKYFGIMDYDKLVNKFRKENIDIYYNNLLLPENFSDFSRIIYSHFNYERRHPEKIEDYYDKINIGKRKVLIK